MKQNESPSILVSTPDPNFSRRHNEYVIEETIRKYNENVVRKQKAYKDKVQERADAIECYLYSKAVDSKPIEKYLGKKNLAYMRGQKIVETLRNGAVILQDIDG